MNDLRKVQRGDPLTIPAGAYNAMIEAASAHQYSQRVLSGRPGGAALAQNAVLVRNDSGEDRAQFDVLAIDGTLVNSQEPPDGNRPEFLRQIAVTGIVPTADYLGRFVILQEPIRPGEVGRAVIGGVTIARVDIRNEDHGFCDSDDNDPTKLESGATGTCQILWKEPVVPPQEPGDRTALAIIRFGGGGGSSAVAAFCVIRNALSDGYLAFQFARWNDDEQKLEPDPTTTVFAKTIVRFKSQVAGGQPTWFNVEPFPYMHSEIAAGDEDDALHVLVQNPGQLMANGVTWLCTTPFAAVCEPGEFGT